MGRETKFGLAFIGLLLVVFSCVLYKRLTKDDSLSDELPIAALTSSGQSPDDCSCVGQPVAGW